MCIRGALWDKICYNVKQLKMTRLFLWRETSLTYVNTKDLLKAFEFKLIAGQQGVSRDILSSEISRPGIELAGHFQFYPKDYLQVIGQKEMLFYLSLSRQEQADRIEQMMLAETPGIIFSYGIDVPNIFIEQANRLNVPIMQSELATTRLISQLTDYLEAQLSPKITMHGVLVDIYGIGVLITGKSGIGKSEVALELIKRGHRLVTDDSVHIRKEDNLHLIGDAPDLIKNHLEIRGLGIINAMSLFGASAIIDQKQISLVVHLELWEDMKQYERLGLDEETIQILDIHLPRAIVPVRPGRNLAVILETAAMNFRLKEMGVNTAQEFSERLTMVINNGYGDSKE